jgi:Flp pilus assembly pilin Flp
MIMFTRFSMNVRRFPRTFVVLCLAIVGTLLVQYGVGRGVGIDSRRVTLNILALTVIALVIDAAIYKFVFMTNYSLQNTVLSILDRLEGRTAAVAAGDPDSLEGGCGDAECASCYPQYNEVLEMSDEPESLIDDERGQDVAEYAVMLAVILAIAVGTIHLIGSNVNNVFSAIGSQIQ